MASLLEYLTGVGEVGATLGSGAVSGLVGAPYGVYKGVTSGKYGTPEGVKVAQQAATDFMARNTYQPRGQVAQEALQGLGGLLNASKLPPVIPEAMALSSVPMKNLASAKKPSGVLAEVGGTPLPSVFVHGTSPENAAAIRKAGKFDPSAGNRQYEYSQLGHRTSYFAPEGSWWLDKEKANNARAISYDDAVRMQLDPSSKVRVVDTEEQLNRLAKEAGFADAYDMMTDLSVDGLGELDWVKKTKAMSFDDFVNNEFKDKRDYMLGQGKWIPKESFDKVKSAKSMDDLRGVLPDWDEFVPSIEKLKETYDSAFNYDYSPWSASDNATNQLIKAGVDGIYISPKYGQSVVDPLANWHPAGDQLALFRPELAKVLEEPVNNKLLDMVGK